MQQENDKVRKVAANYIFLPGSPLVKNGYVEISALRGVRVVDTQGEIKEIPGLEFYGGMIVPDYVCEHKQEWEPGMEMLPFFGAVVRASGRGLPEDCHYRGGGFAQVGLAGKGGGAFALKSWDKKLTLLYPIVWGEVRM